jgi:serine phosphatase RsbU (regulator of sigma subunit)
MEERLLAIAERFWPELETMSGPERRDGVADVVSFLYSAPLVLVGLVWLIAVTDLTLFRTEWPILSLLFVLLFVFERLDFFFFAEVTPGAYSDWQATLGSVIIWSAALIFGPSALWFAVPWLLIFYARWWRRSTSISRRWNCARNFTLHFAMTFASLVALTLYEHWGGVFPLPGLTLEQVLPAFCATFVNSLLPVFLWVPYLIYGTSPPTSKSSLGPYLRFWALAMGWNVLVDPFAILGAGLYVQSGLGGYLFFVAGLLLASFLAHQLSQAVERSQQRSRELEKLEQLGRAIITCCPDASAVSEVLREHVSNMFPYRQIEIRIFPDQTLLHHPDDWPPVGALAWEWLGTTSEAHYFSPGETLPWDKQPASNAVVVAPVLDVETTEPLGGIYLSRRRDLDPLAVKNVLPDALPAVQALAAQVASALNGVQVYEQTLAHQRVEQELALAGQIQASFLPNDLPHVSGWQLTATLEPARQTSGDFYDVIPLPNGRLAIVVADVADKGMGAALYMALSRTLIRTYAVEYHTRPDYVLRVANRRILADAQAGLFVTVFYGVLDPATGALTYCNAGHNPPYLLSARNGDAVQALRRTGMPLGIAGGVTWAEAQNAQEAFFGEERLLEVVRTNLGRPAQDVQDALLVEVHEFVGDAPQFDDIALMVVVRSSTLA